MTVKPVLYSFYRSSAAWRVRIALAIKCVDYEIRPIHILQGDQHNMEYVKLNPLRQVPCLLIDGLTLTQSLPIIEYLDETKPGDKILPDNPAMRFQARQIAEVINSGTQPLQNASVLLKLKKLLEDKQFVKNWGNEVITKGLDAVETILQQTSGKYCVGDQVTLADLTLVPQMLNANAFGVDMAKLPLVSQVHKNLISLEPFQLADPKNQPDFDAQDLKI